MPKWPLGSESVSAPITRSSEGDELVGDLERQVPFDTSVWRRGAKGGFREAAAFKKGIV
jgi:hypothetical protein